MITGRSLATKDVRAVSNAHWFYERYHVDPTGLVLLLDQGDRQSGSDLQTWLDLSGNAVNIEQTTGANQPDITTGRAGYRTFNGTTDFMQEVEIDDETGVTEFRIVTTDGRAAFYTDNVDMSQYATETGDSLYRVVLSKAGANPAWAYIRNQDAAESFGAELVTNGDFASNINGWNNDGANLWDTHQFDAGTLELISDGGNLSRSSSDDNIINETGKLYFISIDVTVNSGVLSEISVRRSVGGTLRTIVAEDISSTQTVTAYYTGTSSSGNVVRFLADNGVACNVNIDNVSVKEVTNLGTTAVHLYDDPAGSNQNLTGEDASFDPNDIDQMEIYKTDLAITGDLTLNIWVELTDGQAASGQYLFSKYEDGGSISYGLKIETTGKVSLITSSDGTTVEGVTTDDVIFTNGAQARTMITGAYDDAGTGVILINGSVVDTSNLVGGGPSTSIYDSAVPFQIGAEAAPGHYLGGDVFGGEVFSRVWSTAETLKRFNADRKRYGV